MSLGGMKNGVMKQVAEKGHTLLSAINDNLGAVQRNFKEVVIELSELKEQVASLEKRLGLDNDKILDNVILDEDEVEKNE